MTLHRVIPGSSSGLRRTPSARTRRTTPTTTARSPTDPRACRRPRTCSRSASTCSASRRRAHAGGGVQGQRDPQEPERRQEPGLGLQRRRRVEGQPRAARRAGRGARHGHQLELGRRAAQGRAQRGRAAGGDPVVRRRRLNGNGVFNVDDFADDARVGEDEPTGQDLIGAFSDGTDADGNGYVDDIAGWDFFDDDNDPADASSYFAAGGHGTGRMNEAAEQANDGAGELGVCPKCTIVPLRIWDTFVSDQNSFAMGVVYAADNDVEVIVGADGGLYHSASPSRRPSTPTARASRRCTRATTSTRATTTSPPPTTTRSSSRASWPTPRASGRSCPPPTRTRASATGSSSCCRPAGSGRPPPSRRTSAAPTPRSTAASRRSPCTGRPAPRTRARRAAPPRS